ncbi:hypothetical protein PPACK8108_LOCUS1212 [Phakopsora pachyrhizi]|uniref:Uncharacterized protein n=1 Tax=Phakopsora pachyrhizi TaxID=170000 RepID=A0AAV0AIG6_PHAPC|nr:hypothetical protein PPACK8108_LOCUS1212 [Phakopsora pachyrhizi]
MTVLIDGKLEDPLIKDKKVSLLGRVICGQKISMGSVSEGSSCPEEHEYLMRDYRNLEKEDDQESVDIGYISQENSSQEEEPEYLEEEKDSLTIDLPGHKLMEEDFGLILPSISGRSVLQVLLANENTLRDRCLVQEFNQGYQNQIWRTWTNLGRLEKNEIIQEIQGPRTQINNEVQEGSRVELTIRTPKNEACTIGIAGIDKSSVKQYLTTIEESTEKGNRKAKEEESPQEFEGYGTQSKKNQQVIKATLEGLEENNLEESFRESPSSSKFNKDSVKSTTPRVQETPPLDIEGPPSLRVASPEFYLLSIPSLVKTEDKLTTPERVNLRKIDWDQPRKVGKIQSPIHLRTPTKESPRGSTSVTGELDLKKAKENKRLCGSKGGDEEVAVEENGWHHMKEKQKLGGCAHQGQSKWIKITGATGL